MSKRQRVEWIDTWLIRRPPEDSRPIFNATLRAAGGWLFFFRRGGSTVMAQIAALGLRLEKSVAAKPAAKLKGFRRRYTNVLSSK